METTDSGKWNEAIRTELQQLKENGTWTEVETIPEGKEVISSKWVLKRKGNNIFKARLVARGFEQYDINECDLYTPVAKLNTFRIFMKQLSLICKCIRWMYVEHF